MMPENGDYWNKEIRSRLWRAKQWKERLELEIKLRRLALEKWVAYINILEQAQELEKELDLEAGWINGANLTKGKTVTESLIIFAMHMSDYTFASRDAISWLVEQKLYSDEDNARSGADGILAHRTDLFRRQDRAVYQLTPKAVEIGKGLTQPRLPLTIQEPESVTSSQGNLQSAKEQAHTTVAQFIIASLKGGEKPLRVLKTEAEKAGISFGEKHPGRVLHLALVGMAQHGLVEKVNGVWRLKERR